MTPSVTCRPTWSSPPRRPTSRSTTSSTARRSSSPTPAPSRSTSGCSTRSASARTGTTRWSTSPAGHRSGRGRHRGRSWRPAAFQGGLRVDISTADLLAPGDGRRPGRRPGPTSRSAPPLAPRSTRTVDLDDALAREEHSVAVRRAAFDHHSTAGLALGAGRARRRAARGAAGGQRPAGHQAAPDARLRAAPGRPPARRRRRAGAGRPRLRARARRRTPGASATAPHQVPPRRVDLLRRRPQRRGARRPRRATCCSRSTTTTGTAPTRWTTCCWRAATPAPTWSACPASSSTSPRPDDLTVRRNHPTEIFDRFVAGGTICSTAACSAAWAASGRCAEVRRRPAARRGRGGRRPDLPHARPRLRPAPLASGHTWQRDAESFRRPDIVAPEWTGFHASRALEVDERDLP